MKIEQIWRNERRKRDATEARRQRVNRNWPIHAEKVLFVFAAFARLAEQDGVHVIISIPEWLESNEQRRQGRPLGSVPIGTSSLILQFGMRYTGEGLTTSTPESEQTEMDVELGSQLIIHHSEADGIVQVFLEEPRMRSEDRPEPLLLAYTYETDDVTHAWTEKLIRKFLTFNRFESRLEDCGLVDSWRVRWWRFKDIRNRRGYLEKFHHILTPWESVLLGAMIALPSFALIQWLWSLLYPHA